MAPCDSYVSRYVTSVETRDGPSAVRRHSPLLQKILVNVKRSGPDTASGFGLRHRRGNRGRVGVYKVQLSLEFCWRQKWHGARLLNMILMDF